MSLLGGSILHDDQIEKFASSICILDSVLKLNSGVGTRGWGKPPPQKDTERARICVCTLSPHPLGPVLEV